MNNTITEEVSEEVDEYSEGIWSYSNNYESNECPICMELFEPSINKPFTTECGHTFCIKCFILVNLKSDKCPICRQQMQQIQIIQRTTLPEDPSGIHNHNHTIFPPHNCFQIIFNFFYPWSRSVAIYPIHS